MDDSKLIYLDTYILQKDMRIRLPKCIEKNLNIESGKARFKIFLNLENNEIVLQVDHDNYKG